MCGLTCSLASIFLPVRRGTNIALCSHVCVCVCSSAIITCAKLHHSVTVLEVCQLTRPRFVKLDLFCVA